MAGFGALQSALRRLPHAARSPYPPRSTMRWRCGKPPREWPPAKNMAIFGSSAGGASHARDGAQAKLDKLPLPGAIAPGTPMADLTGAGDSFHTNAMVDNVLVAATAQLRQRAALYANGHDLKDPLLSPVYGDISAFPPAILNTGTRDLLLYNTVRVHRKLRQAGVEAALYVLRRTVARAAVSRLHCARGEGSVRRDRALLRQAPGEIGLYRVHRCRPADEATGCGAASLSLPARSGASITAVIGTASASKPITKTGNRKENTSRPPGTGSAWIDGDTHRSHARVVHSDDRDAHHEPCSEPQHQGTREPA